MLLRLRAFFIRACYASLASSGGSIQEERRMRKNRQSTLDAPVLDRRGEGGRFRRERIRDFADLIDHPLAFPGFSRWNRPSV